MRNMLSDNLKEEAKIELAEKLKTLHLQLQASLEPALLALNLAEADMIDW